MKREKLIKALVAAWREAENTNNEELKRILNYLQINIGLSKEEFIELDERCNAIGI